MSDPPKDQLPIDGSRLRLATYFVAVVAVDNLS
jgi:hypothetical protein